MATSNSPPAVGKLVSRGRSQQGHYPTARLFVITVCLLLPLLLTAVSAKKLHKKHIIEYYLHNVFNASAYTILPPVTTNYTGWTNIYDDLLTRAPDVSSKKVGTMSGIEVVTSTGQPFSGVLLLHTINYDDGVYKGTLNQQGVLNYNVPKSQISVVSGTGDFLGVYGYGERTFISSSVVEGLSTTVVYFKTYLFRS